MDFESIKRSRLYQYLKNGATKPYCATNYHFLPRDTSLPLCEICMAAGLEESPFHERIYEHLLLIGEHVMRLRCLKCNKPLIIGEPATKCPFCCLELNRFLNNFPEEEFKKFLTSNNCRGITIEASRKLEIPQNILNTYITARRYP